MSETQFLRRFGTKPALVLMGVFCIASLLVNVSLADKHWSSSAIKGRVVDAESGEPLSDVIVVASWQLSGTSMGSYPFGQIALYEVTTNSNGQFAIPAWKRSAHRNLTVHGSEPRVRVFRDGYLPLITDNKLPNGGYDLQNEIRNMHPQLNGKTIELVPYHGASVNYAAQLEPLRDSLYGLAFHAEDCFWKRTPRMMVEMDRLKIFRVRDLGVNEICGSAMEFFKRLGWSEATRTNM